MLVKRQEALTFIHSQTEKLNSYSQRPEWRSIAQPEIPDRIRQYRPKYFCFWPLPTPTRATSTSAPFGNTGNLCRGAAHSLVEMSSEHRPTSHPGIFSPDAIILGSRIVTNPHAAWRRQ